jgi:hypothetical protein
LGGVAAFIVSIRVLGSRRFHDQVSILAAEGKFVDASGRPEGGRVNTNRLPLKTRIALVAAWLPVALAVLLAGWPAREALPPGMLADQASARNWLAVIALAYAASYVLAWFTRNSWSISMVRLLLWGLVAFLCISEVVDLFGGHQDVGWQVVGAAGSGDPATIDGLRGQLLCWGLALLMSLTCVFVGFEEPEGHTDVADEAE